MHIHSGEIFDSQEERASPVVPISQKELEEIQSFRCTDSYIQFCIYVLLYSVLVLAFFCK